MRFHRPRFVARLFLVAVLACLASPLVAAPTTYATNQVEYGAEQEGGMWDSVRRPQLLNAEQSLGVKRIRYTLYCSEIALCDPRGASARGVAATSAANPAAAASAHR